MGGARHDRWRAPVIPALQDLGSMATATVRLTRHQLPGADFLRTSSDNQMEARVGIEPA